MQRVKYTWSHNYSLVHLHVSMQLGLVVSRGMISPNLTHSHPDKMVDFSLRTFLIESDQIGSDFDWSSRGGDWTSLIWPATAPSTHPHGASHHTLHRAQHSPQHPPPRNATPPHQPPPPRLPAPTPTAPRTTPPTAPSAAPSTHPRSTPTTPPSTPATTPSTHPTAPPTTPPSTPSAAPSTRPHGTPHHPAQHPLRGSQHPPPRHPTHTPPPSTPSAAPSTHPHGTPHHPAQHPLRGSQHPPPPPPYDTPHPPPRPAYPPGVVAIFPHRKNSGGRWKNGTRPLCQPGLRLSACQWCNTLTRKSRQAPRPMISMYIPNEESTKSVHTVSKQQEPHEDGSPLAGLGAHISENPHSQPV